MIDKMEKKGNVEEEIFNCPFCNLEPLRLGFDESREKYNIDYDQVTLHCPGCGVDMKELRKDDETEDKTYSRLLKKWSMRKHNLGIDLDNVIYHIDMRGRALINLIGKQIETIGLLTSFSDEMIKMDNGEGGASEMRHKYILTKIKLLKQREKFYKCFSSVLISIVIILCWVIKIISLK